MRTSPPHPRSITISSRKGGVGKTSLTAHIAALAAERGYAVLAVDMDPQSNLKRDLGVHGTPIDDNGEALLESVLFNRPLKVARGVRPNLDLVVGGGQVEMAANMTADSETEKRQALRRVLEPIWDDYDLIVIDSPPLVSMLREMSLAAVQYAVIPTRGDAASIDGVTGIAGDFSRVREANPHLELLGVVLFGMGSSAKAIRAEVRQKLIEGLGTVAPVFNSEIRHVEAPAVNARNSGQLVHEYARGLADAPRFTDRKKGVTANKLATDYAALTAELLTTIEQRNADRDQQAKAVSS